jgi:hypothetical protein
VNDRRAAQDQFPLIPLALSMYLLAIAADAVGLLLGGAAPWDTISFIFTAMGTIAVLRATTAPLEDLLSFHRSFSPLQSASLVAYAFGAAILCLWGGVMRQTDPTSHLAPLLTTFAASTAVFAFGHVAASRKGRGSGDDNLRDLSATQRIARASLNF